MTILVSIFLSDILPVFAIAAAGFVLARKLHANVKTMAHVSFYLLTPDGYRDSTAEHRLILDAIVAKDRTKVEELVRMHCEHSKRPRQG